MTNWINAAVVSAALSGSGLRVEPLR